MQDGDGFNFLKSLIAFRHTLKRHLGSPRLG